MGYPVILCGQVFILFYILSSWNLKTSIGVILVQVSVIFIDTDWAKTGSDVRHIGKCPVVPGSPDIGPGTGAELRLW